MHERFGKGEIVNLEGIGADKKAEIRFEVGGIEEIVVAICKVGCDWVRR
jgi:DNA helicase-2/ATP-dependent DNA helicase PcrA